jgi:tRNA (cmo5U34)-methyltransferase
MTEWTEDDHALLYLARAEDIPHRDDGERALLEQVPVHPRRILDLGTGDGRLVRLICRAHNPCPTVGLDVSEFMLGAAREACGELPFEGIRHDLAEPLPALGQFDAVVSSFAIHHLEHPRKRELFREVYGVLAPGGIFANLEHVASPTPELHANFLSKLGLSPETEDPCNRLLDVETQLQWLREAGFDHVDCYWKWLELALLVGKKPGEHREQHA